jgi:hypothetical protein
VIGTVRTGNARLGLGTVLATADWIILMGAGSAAAMRVRTYRDEAGSRHFDLIGGVGHPWSVDLVATAASGLLVLGFAGGLVAIWVQ